MLLPSVELAPQFGGITDPTQDVGHLLRDELLHMLVMTVLLEQLEIAVYGP